MSTSTTSARPLPWRTRRGRITILTVVLLVIATVAWALVTSSVNTRGQVGRGQYVAVWGNSGGVLENYETDGNGNPTGNGTVLPAVTKSADLKTITLPSGLATYYGEAIVLTSPVQTVQGTSRLGYVSGIEVTGTVPAGWRIWLHDGCGKTVGTSAVSAAVIKLAMRPTSDTGPDLDLDALGGLRVVTTALPANVTEPPANVTCAALGS